MSKCQRGTVYASGTTDYKEFYFAENYNKGVCTAEVGNCGCVHAEIALLEICPNPVHVIVSMSPCLNCAKALVAAGVKKVDFLELYRIHDGIKYLEEHGVTVTYLKE